jgi:hypothetical protein
MQTTVNNFCITNAENSCAARIFWLTWCCEAAPQHRSANHFLKIQQQPAAGAEFFLQLSIAYRGLSHTRGAFPGFFGTLSSRDETFPTCSGRCRHVTKPSRRVRDAVVTRRNLPDVFGTLSSRDDVVRSIELSIQLFH